MRGLNKWHGIFEIDPESVDELDWIDTFVREEIEPVDLVVEHAWNPRDPVRNDLIQPLQTRVKERAVGLPPRAGAGRPRYGQVKLALMNEILGRSRAAPVVFGCQAPDSGNAEILAHYGTEEQKAAVPPAAARQRDRLLLLDDRAAGRLRPGGVHHARVATATSG